MREKDIIPTYFNETEIIDSMAENKAYLQTISDPLERMYAAWLQTEGFCDLPQSGLSLFACAVRQGAMKTKLSRDLHLELEGAICAAESAAEHAGFAAGVRFAIAAINNDGALYPQILAGV